MMLRIGFKVAIQRVYSLLKHQKELFNLLILRHIEDLLSIVSLLDLKSD
jgi:hypothetical protein